MNGNGNGYEYYGDEYTSQPIASVPAPEYSTGGIVPSGGGILQSLQSVFEKFTSRPASTADGIGGQLYNAIYAFGAGKLDLARETAARALLASKTGASFVGVVEQERIKQLLPMFIVGAVVLFGIAFAIGRR